MGAVRKRVAAINSDTAARVPQPPGPLFPRRSNIGRTVNHRIDSIQNDLYADAIDEQLHIELRASIPQNIEIKGDSSLKRERLGSGKDTACEEQYGRTKLQTRCITADVSS